MENYPNIHVVDMHTWGEPLRIITAGYPKIEGDTILEKRRFVTQHLDHLRKFLMFEPRGHKEMYGALLVEPSQPNADIAVIFMHNDGYSAMCGLAVIALGRYALDEGLVECHFPKTIVKIECPCGLVQVEVDPITYESSFISVPAFASILKQEIELESEKKEKVDIYYDRSAAGSITSRMAQAYASSIYHIGEKANFKNVVNSEFNPEIYPKNDLASLNEVQVKVTGKGFYIGHSTFFLDVGDELGKGFLFK
ncbi:proline racemase family protein [Acinetobacter calcoaceticus]|uniref:proline racemase family protein n=1 Tax=Acinetobacter calcoaceticus TaxID=471 RepID=UPI00192CE26B|nr:proline racemase family protein [Acinetobacter calcoaceticus]